MARLLRCLAATALLCFNAASRAQARFDLPGPTIDIRVTRAGMSLPIARVPNLQAGDQIWLHPALPPTQSVHYLLIAVFLRGTTNPPPSEWFTRIETWNKKVHEEGTTVTVPEGAQQAILFLAPETGGDFSTLRSAVQGRPGVFVRASQDLTEAGFEQARIETYLAAMKLVPPGDTAALLDHSNLLARTLNLRPNPDCFKRALDQQYNCLTQTGTQTLLDDGHGQTLLTSLSTGPSSDFINAASNTRLAAGGNYSAYVGALVDFAHIVSSIHTAQYQYIPGLATPRDESLDLRLNTPPSFHNPKSVIVIGLPAIQNAIPPPLRPSNPHHVSCLLDPHLILPVEGAPLVFSTAFAHSLVLHLDTRPAGADPQDIPLTPDAFQGGLTLAPAPSNRAPLPLNAAGSTQSSGPKAAPNLDPKLKNEVAATGTIRGLWGFDPFTGPTLQLQQTPGSGWRLVAPGDPAGSEPALLIAGQPNHLQLESSGTACIQTIAMDPGLTKVPYKIDDNASSGKVPVAQPVDLTLNLQHTETPGSLRLAIQQFGRTEPDQVGTKTFAEPAKIDAFRLHAGDASASLAGTSLDQVQTLTIPGKDLTFTPRQQQAESGKTLSLALPADAHTPVFKPGERLAAEIHLKDGRTLQAATSVLPPRPSVSLLSRRATSATPTPIQLSSPGDLPLGAELHFFLKSRDPFARTEQIELANSDESLHTTLTVQSGALILEDAHTVLATFDPLKTFGPSTFGPFQLRALPPDGSPASDPGEWVPLATIVRLPTLTALTCPPDITQPCLLSGDNLFLLDSVSNNVAFLNPTEVPQDFVDTTLAIAHTSSPTLYLKLRDDPASTHTATLPLSITRQLPSHQPPMPLIPAATKSEGPGF